MSEDPSSDSTKRERERAGAGQVALVSTPAERGSECDGGRRAVSERRWRGRRQVQESESVACTRKCHGHAVGGVDGAEALRGCTLRRACASVSKWRASERAVPVREEEFYTQRRKKKNKGKGKGKGKGKSGECWNCGEEVHFARECPNPPKEPAIQALSWPKGKGRGKGGYKGMPRPLSERNKGKYGGK